MNEIRTNYKLILCMVLSITLFTVAKSQDIWVTKKPSVHKRVVKVFVVDDQSKADLVVLGQNPPGNYLNVFQVKWSEAVGNRGFWKVIGDERSENGDGLIKGSTPEQADNIIFFVESAKSADLVIAYTLEKEHSRWIEKSKAKLIKPGQSKTCPYCRGNFSTFCRKTCDSCYGKGRVKDFFDKEIICMFCAPPGSGRCRQCGGSGETTCDFCISGKRTAPKQDTAVWLKEQERLAKLAIERDPKYQAEQARAREERVKTKEAKRQQEQDARADSLAKLWEENKSKALLDGVVPDLSFPNETRILMVGPWSSFSTGGTILAIKISPSGEMVPTKSWTEVKSLLARATRVYVRVKWRSLGYVTYESDVELKENVSKLWETNKSYALLDGVVPDSEYSQEPRILVTGPSSKFSAGGVILAIQISAEAKMVDVNSWAEVKALVAKAKTKSVRVRWQTASGNTYEFGIDLLY